MRFVCCLLLIGLSACGKTVSMPTIDPSAQKYVDQWNSLYPDHYVTVDVVLGDLSANSGAVGQWDGVQVTLDSTYWAKLSDFARQEVVYHELGHAMFGYGHDWDDTVPDYMNGVEVSINRSIMYPYIFGDDPKYTYFFDYYKEQLANCTTCTSLVNGNGKVSKKETLNPGQRID